MVRRAPGWNSAAGAWAGEVLERRPAWLVTVALANKRVWVELDFPRFGTGPTSAGHVVLPTRMEAVLTRGAISSHTSRRRRRAFKPDAASACGLIGGLLRLLLGTGLVACSRACRRRRARAGELDGEPGAAGHGPGSRPGLLTLPRGPQPGALGRTRRSAHAPGIGARRLSACGRGRARCRRYDRAPLGHQDQGARALPRPGAFLSRALRPC